MKKRNLEDAFCEKSSVIRVFIKINIQQLLNFFIDFTSMTGTKHYCLNFTRKLSDNFQHLLKKMEKSRIKKKCLNNPGAVLYFNFSLSFSSISLSINIYLFIYLSMYLYLYLYLSLSIYIYIHAYIEESGLKRDS